MEGSNVLRMRGSGTAALDVRGGMDAVAVGTSKTVIMSSKRWGGGWWEGD
jgi:hypothetical protein